MQINDFQINLPFTGGAGCDSTLGYPLAINPLRQFLSELFDIWIERGYDRGVTLGPFDKFLEYRLAGDAGLPCILRGNCSNEFLCIDPGDNVAQCDCWVASYPEHWYGNIFEPGSLADLLKNSTARRAFRERLSAIIQREDCLDCEHLSMCHGGCPIRAYSVYGSLNRKDPYCEAYKAVFRRITEAAATLPFRRSQKTWASGNS